MGADIKTVAVSGYFDPIHKGHIAMFEEAKKLGDKLIVIINNDEQTMAKKQFVFMNAEDRAEIIRHIGCVDEVFIAIDIDRTVCESLKKIRPTIFANGGDRFADNIPEAIICKEYGIEMAFGIGGGKVASSSQLVAKATNHQQSMQRDWGNWFVLEKGIGYKVKRLSVLPHKSLSYQIHQHRSEHWIIVDGHATVFAEGSFYSFEPNDHLHIPKNHWHQLINNTDEMLEVIEVATGDYIEEDDIERKEI